MSTFFFRDHRKSKPGEAALFGELNTGDWFLEKSSLIGCKIEQVDPSTHNCICFDSGGNPEMRRMDDCGKILPLEVEATWMPKEA